MKKFEIIDTFKIDGHAVVSVLLVDGAATVEAMLGREIEDVKPDEPKLKPDDYLTSRYTDLTIDHEKAINDLLKTHGANVSINAEKKAMAVLEAARLEQAVALLKGRN